VAPPGNQAANGENKLQPVAMGGPGLLDYYSPKGAATYQRKPDQVVSFFKTKIVGSVVMLKPDFS